jgi:two-component system response regulator FlrC
MQTAALSATLARTPASACAHGDDPVACDSASLQLLDIARRVARSECTVLIAGESGTGKEVIARFLHRQSHRHGGPFVAVNCAAIPEHMLEAMLFGWERGAFTGAHSAHQGKFEQAQGGTLLLDEISELPLALQAKLLRVLQEHEVERLGARLPVSLDVRLLATTNRRLREEVAAGRFREDLYYRLNVFPLAISALRTRRADILPLAMRLLASYSSPGGRIPALAADAGQKLLAHSWPGNVRELENVMQRALVLCDGGIIQSEHICFEVAEPQVGTVPALASPATVAPLDATGAIAAAARTVPPFASGDLAGTRCAAEYELILETLRHDGSSRERVAERLGISPRTLRYKLARMRAAGIGLGVIGSAA